MSSDRSAVGDLVNAGLALFLVAVLGPAVLAVVAGVPGATQIADLLTGPEPTAEARDQVGDPDRAARRLAALMVAPRSDLTGYDRRCDRGHRCVYGPAWSDDVTVPGGRNGCDTRNDILRRDAEPGTLRTKPGTHGCVVATGRWISPYTGALATTPTQIEIDHIVPLAEAWRSGARTWSPTRRRQFANDPRELLAVDVASNRAKRDHGPQRWRPARAAHCDYAIRWIDVKTTYRLTVNNAERTALAAMLRRCPHPPTRTP